MLKSISILLITIIYISPSLYTLAENTSQRQVPVKPDLSQSQSGTSFDSTIKPVGSPGNANPTVITFQEPTPPPADEHSEKLDNLTEKIQNLEQKIDILSAKTAEEPDQNKANATPDASEHKDETSASEQTNYSKINKIVPNKAENNNSNESSQNITSHEQKQYNNTNNDNMRNVPRSINPQKGHAAHNLNTSLKGEDASSVEANAAPKVPAKTTDFISRIGNLVTKEFGFFVKMSAIISNVIMSLTPLPSIIKIHKQSSTDNISGLPYLSLLISTFFFTLYGYLSKKSLLLITNTFGFVMSFIYVLIFHNNCHDVLTKIKLITYYKITGGILSSVFISFLFCKSETFLIVVGVFAALSSFLSYSSPLESFHRIFKEKNTSCLPIEICLGNFWSSIFMLSYGFTIWDHFVIVPNFLGILVGSLQLGILLIYPRSERQFSYIDDYVHGTTVVGNKLI